MRNSVIRKLRYRETMLDHEEANSRAHLPQRTIRAVSRGWMSACSRPFRETEPRREIELRCETGPRRGTGHRPRASSGRSTASDCEHIKTPTERPRGLCQSLVKAEL